MHKLADSPIVIITPVYEDTEAATQLFYNLALEFDKRVYVIAVDDGSVNKPLSVSIMDEAGVNGLVIKLKRNVGHQRAIAIGLNYVAERMESSNRVVVMDSDGEDTPSSIKNLLGVLGEKEADLVVARRKSRQESLSFRLFYVVYKWVFRVLSGQNINFGNFMLLNAAAVKRLTSMQELSIHLAACVLLSKLSISTCGLDRGSRYAGKSKMNFVGLVLHGFKGLMVFSENVLVRVGVACAVIATLSILGGIIAVLLKFFAFATPGWFSVALGILLLVFLQTGTLTLVSLMLTGIVKNGSNAKINHEEFIDNIEFTDKDKEVC